MKPKLLEQFLTHLAVEKKVAPAPQNQVSNALLFLYREVLNKDIIKSPLDF